MILDNKNHLDRYARLGKHFETAIEFIRKNDLSALPEGEFEIDGTSVFAIVSDRELVAKPNFWEVHGRYADLQYIVAGREVIEYCPLEYARAKIVFPEGKDVCVLEDLEGREVELREDEFAIFLPLEIHRPNCPSALSGRTKKVIFKVLSES